MRTSQKHKKETSGVGSRQRKELLRAEVKVEDVLKIRNPEAKLQDVKYKEPQRLRAVETKMKLNQRDGKTKGRNDAHDPNKGGLGSACFILRPSGGEMKSLITSKPELEMSNFIY